MTSHTTPTWRSRITAALVAIPLSFVVTIAVAPYTSQTFTGGPATSGVVTSEAASTGRVSAATGHIASSSAGFSCDETDALSARSAIVRRDGELVTSRVRASKAWDLAEQGEAFVLGWCA